MLQPTAWEIQSESAVPKARRRTRVLAIPSPGAAGDATSVGIRQYASNSHVESAERVEEPVVARVDGD